MDPTPFRVEWHAWFHKRMSVEWERCHRYFKDAESAQDYCARLLRDNPKCGAVVLMEAADD